MKIRCPECTTLMAVKMDGLTRGKKAQVTCRCGQKCRFTVPTRPKSEAMEALMAMVKNSGIGDFAP